MVKILQRRTREVAATSASASCSMPKAGAQRKVAVEVNREIVPRSLHAQRTVRDGDRVEIVHAIGGGRGEMP
jgi:sulfur carrier protein